MGWMQLTAKLASSLAWPAVVFIFVVVFRSEIANKIAQLKSFKSKYLSGEFAAITTNVDAAVQNAASMPLTKKPKSKGMSFEVKDDTAGDLIGSVAKTPLAESQKETIEYAPVFEASTTPVDEEKWTSLENAASVDPRYAIRVAGIEIDQSLLRLAAPYGQPASAQIATSKLVEAKVIPKDLGAAVTELMRLRDRTQGSLEIPILASDASRFIQSARSVCTFLDTLPR